MRIWTWKTLLLLLLLLAGVVYSHHLTSLVLAQNDAGLFCSQVAIFDCATNLHSGYGKIFGIPVSAFSTAVFIFLIVQQAAAAWRFRKAGGHWDDTRRQAVFLAPLVLGYLCLAVVLYYAVISAFVLRSWCIYCAGLYAIIVAIVVLARIGFGASWRDQVRIALHAGRSLFSVRPAWIYAASALALLSVAIVPALHVGDPSAVAFLAKIKKSSHEPLTVLEFLDFECPACKQAACELDKLAAEFPGRLAVRLVHRPMPTHTLANLAARLCLALQENGKGQAFADRLLQNADEVNEPLLRSIVLELGENPTETWQRAESATIKATLQADQDLAEHLGVIGTPTLAVKGKLLTGPQGVNILASMVSDTPAHDSNSAASSSSSFLAATAAAPSSPTPSALTALSDFTARCAAPGVVRFFGFDSTADFNIGGGGTSGAYGQNYGLYPPYGTSNYTLATQDTTQMASGTSSLKFTIPANSGSDSSGSWFTNFSDDLSTQFGENSEFYIQWRQRFSTEFITTNFAGSGGWKQDVIGTGDTPGVIATSCTNLEVVTQNSYLRGFPALYNSCTGSTSHGPYNPFEEPYGTYDFKMQNARTTPFCLYSQGSTSYFAPIGNCFGYVANEWMTFQIHIKTGPRVSDEFSNSYVELWGAREGQPSEQIFNWGPYNLSAGSLAANQKFGKIWLLPYQTGKSAAVTNPIAYTWYDELIISTNRIADPGGIASDTTLPSIPDSLVATAVSPSRINLSWNASTDNLAVTGYKIYRGGSQIGMASGTSFQDMGLSASTVYLYTVAAFDAAGNTSAQSSGANATTMATKLSGNKGGAGSCGSGGGVGLLVLVVALLSHAFAIRAMPKAEGRRELEADTSGELP